MDKGKTFKFKQIKRVMINIFLFLSIVFFFTLVIGRQLEKIRIPWIFASLILGVGLAFWNPFEAITSSETFEFLANLGMYFLLFIIGFEIDLKDAKKHTGFLVKTTFFIVLFETFFGSLFIHFVMGAEWFLSLVIAFSFATVGEAILVPILDEFKLLKRKIGQTIMSIGAVDNILEVISLSIAVFIIGSSSETETGLLTITASFITLFLLTTGLRGLEKQRRGFQFHDLEVIFFVSMAMLFLFLGIGDIAGIAPLGALLAGISLKTFIPKRRLKYIESEIKTMSYGFFAPIFFLWVCLGIDAPYISTSIGLVIGISALTMGAKVFAMWVAGRKRFKTKKSILMGIGLSAKFSIGIVIVKMFYDNMLITQELFSLIVISNIILNLIVPLLFSELIQRWLPLGRRAEKKLV
jgi:Ca2+-transporting ATPase